jgi:putative DeoR family transcriptional regulator (stage III sporulation protein D)
VGKVDSAVGYAQWLKKINPSLYSDVRRVLEKNKEERHIRGGIATKEKYSKISK